MSGIPENLVVITDGAKKGQPGLVHADDGGDTVTIQISFGTIQKARNQFRPFTLRDFVVL